MLIEKRQRVNHAAVCWGDSQHSCSGVPWTHTTTPPSIWGPAQGAADGKWLFGQVFVGSIPPTTHQLGLRGGGVPAPRWEGDGCDLTLGCVGAAWGGRASLELGAWQGSPAKLPLTSGDGEQHSFIATASSLRLQLCDRIPAGWSLKGKSSCIAQCCLRIQP